MTSCKFNSLPAGFVRLFLYASISMKIFCVSKHSFQEIQVKQKVLCKILLALREDSGLSGLKANSGGLKVSIVSGSYKQ